MSDSPSRRRFRTYIRDGWHIVDVPRKNLYDYTRSKDWGNSKHYKEIRTWCEQQFVDGNWDSRIFSSAGSSKPGVKQFAFKHQEDLLMFMLMWS
jgi:hypothetical protein